MGVDDHKCHALKQVGCAVITVSTTRTSETDESGKLIMNILTKNGHIAFIYKVIKDDKTLIQKTVKDILTEKGISAIIINGGTGISKNDVTIEAITPLLDKELSGFGELFRTLSYKEIGSAAIMSRAIAGVSNGKIIICTPGSTNAVKLAMEKLVIPELGHMAWEITKEK